MYNFRLYHGFKMLMIKWNWIISVSKNVMDQLDEVGGIDERWWLWCWIWILMHYGSSSREPISNSTSHKSSKMWQMSKKQNKNSRYKCADCDSCVVYLCHDCVWLRPVENYLPMFFKFFSVFYTNHISFLILQCRLYYFIF